MELEDLPNSQKVYDKVDRDTAVLNSHENMIRLDGRIYMLSLAPDHANDHLVTHYKRELNRKWRESVRDLAHYVGTIEKTFRDKMRESGGDVFAFPLSIEQLQKGFLQTKDNGVTSVFIPAKYSVDKIVYQHTDGNSCSIYSLKTPTAPRDIYIKISLTFDKENRKFVVNNSDFLDRKKIKTLPYQFHRTSRGLCTGELVLQEEFDSILCGPGRPSLSKALELLAEKLLDSQKTINMDSLALYRNEETRYGFPVNRKLVALIGTINALRALDRDSPGFIEHLNRIAEPIETASEADDVIVVDDIDDIDGDDIIERT